ncbi:MAG: NADPH:quinone reductase-like Zn-dependent oxidoreductase [Planctomycetota bacterium]|jgi:NADPH:quinone reductase-like Zn-dependent oxidoreductase
MASSTAQESQELARSRQGEDGKMIQSSTLGIINKDDLPMMIKAVVQDAWGTPDVLQIETIPRPQPKPGEVVIRMRAASLNQGDWHLMMGEPYLIRCVGFGFSKPKNRIPGQYLAGEVVARGDGVVALELGDHVFGTCKQAFAEYVCVAAQNLAPMPTNLNFEEAASVPHGGFSAIQALRDAGKLKAGQNVLVIGAAGAVGSMAVQIAKSMGAEVTGVCRATQMEQVRALGADVILDYEVDDFSADGERYHLILDMVHDRPNSHYRRALFSGGKSIMVGGGQGQWLGGMGGVLFAAFTSLFSKKKLVPFLAIPKTDDLHALSAMIENGVIRPPVDRTFPLAQTADAFRYLESKITAGMIALTSTRS